MISLRPSLHVWLADVHLLFHIQLGILMQAGPGPGSASARPGSSVDPLTNHPMDYDPVTNEHTAKMTMARSTALEYYQAGK